MAAANKEILKYLNSIEADVGEIIHDRISYYAGTAGSKRSANLKAGLSITMSIIGLGVSVALLVVPIFG